ncbi:RNA polymerase sigma factor FliA [Thermomonas alba]|uniref:RNA polymerase sigma factor FliA n=1 Tax=Thermomonas alba TaxID=2888525 RepID=UPI001F033829|nr:RNA polymerase sigma factor FliA [Thermomonas alba]
MNTAAAHYRSQQNGDAAAIVARHSELVRRIAHHLAARLPSSVEIDDLIQAGMIGLIEAARNFQSDQGATFETYASIRIRGAMIDAIRAGDWVPRSVHRRYRDIVATTRAIEQREGRAATAQEIAAALGMSMDDYYQVLQDAARGQLVSLDEYAEEHDGEPQLGQHDNATPARRFEQSAFREALTEAIDHLPEREKLVLSLYYEQELNLREIGSVLNVSESRVCQIHGQAMLRLRARLTDWRGELDDEEE